MGILRNGWKFGRWARRGSSPLDHYSRKFLELFNYIKGTHKTGGNQFRQSTNMSHIICTHGAFLRKDFSAAFYECCSVILLGEQTLKEQDCLCAQEYPGVGEEHASTSRNINLQRSLIQHWTASVPIVLSAYPNVRCANDMYAVNQVECPLL